MKYVLYGPPGIGKSTTITKLKEAGFAAFDLEMLDTTEQREAVLDALDNCFVGGADTRPDVKPDRINILLGLDEDAYRERRQQRDLDQPEKAQQTEQRLSEWKAASQVWNLYLVADDTAIDKLLTLVYKPNIRIQPKPHKDHDNWTTVVADHHDSVEALMSWFAFVIAQAGRAHDHDKLYQDNPSHGEQAHHWYRGDHSSLDDVTLFALLESIADTVATTWGRYLNDPWERKLWNPPEQSLEWVHDVYYRTLRQTWQAADTTEPIETFPGFHMFDTQTQTGSDD